MRPLSIFVSSTCYDLKLLREHLRAEIRVLGHDPVLSEYPTFPVSPDLSTVENCKRVVRDRADMLVLIIGGKRGSLDSSNGRSVVNSEYREACAAGLDCIVFVDSQVWALRHLFKKNQTMDFSPTVDFPAVFEFINEIESSTKWIFQFSRTDEITTTLREQLSIRFSDLLSRNRENKIFIAPEFSRESATITRIVQDKGDFWEYQLASAILAERFSRIEMKFADIESGYVVRRVKFLRTHDTIEHIQNLLSDISNIVAASLRILSEQLTPAFGPPGLAGDAIQIKRACDNLYELFLTLFEWELDVRFVRPNEIFDDIFKRMHGWSGYLLSEFKRIPAEMDELLARPDLSGEHHIRLIIDAPPGLTELADDFEKLIQDPEVISAIVESL